MILRRLIAWFGFKRQQPLQHLTVLEAAGAKKTEFDLTEFGQLLSSGRREDLKKDRAGHVAAGSCPLEVWPIRRLSCPPAYFGPKFGPNQPAPDQIKHVGSREGRGGRH